MNVAVVLFCFILICFGSQHPHRHRRQILGSGVAAVDCDGHLVCPDGPCQPPVKRPRHDCFVGQPPKCKNAYSSDTICRGARGNSITAYLNMSCDYVVQVVPSPVRPVSWVVVVHGICDRGALEVTEWLHKELSVSYYGFRPCIGLSAPCMTQNMTVCDTLHLSWAGNDTTTGFNEPQLESIYRSSLTNPNSSLLWIHEYDEDDSDYKDWSTLPCMISGKPDYVCISGDNQKGTFDSKFRRMAEQFALMSNSSHVQCQVIAIDARNRTAKSALPCSNVYFDNAVTDFHWELSFTLAQSIGVAILGGPAPNPNALNSLIPLREAARIALE